MRYAIACLFVALLAATAQAQVFRCTEGGKTTYSDTPCAPNQNGHQIARQKTQQQLDLEQAQADEAEWRKQQRLMNEQQQELAEQQQRALQPMPAPVVRHSGNDWQMRKDLENAKTSAGSITNNGGRWDQAAETARERARREDARRQPPTVITTCNPGFCYDNQGGTYHRVSPDFMTGPNGRTCHRVGDMWNCS